MPRMRDAIRSGWKTSKSSSFSPADANRIGTPVTVDGWRGTAAVMPSSLVDTTPGEADALAERPLSRWRVLADHGIEHEQRLVRATARDRRAPGPSVLVDTQPACGVHDDDVEVLGLGFARPADATATGSAVAGALCSSTEVPGVRRGHSTRRLRSPTILSWCTAPGRRRSHATRSGVLALEPLGCLPASVVLPAPCRPGQHDHGFAGSWRRPVAGLATEDAADEPSLTILTTCWAGFSAAETSAPWRGPDARDERTHHRQRNVGLQQRQPDS